MPSWRCCAPTPSMPRRDMEETIGGIQMYQEVGGLVGRFVLAFLATIIVSRRLLLWLFQVPGLILIPLVYFLPAAGLLFPGHPEQNAEWLKAGVFVAGFLTIAQFSFWGNYLPRRLPDAPARHRRELRRQHRRPDAGNVGPVPRGHPGSRYDVLRPRQVRQASPTPPASSSSSSTWRRAFLRSSCRSRRRKSRRSEIAWRAGGVSPLIQHTFGDGMPNQGADAPRSPT